MSHVLFLCSGNTCRSPIAAGIAKRVFGPSHTIVSAGAETATGGPIAPNAVCAAHELGVDISRETTRDVAELDLARFDLIVIFRPSSAEDIALPERVVVEHLDVDDPYGSSLDTYKLRARQIERGVRRLYVNDALRRMAGGPQQASSHLAGIFNRAAKECEMEVVGFLASCVRHRASPKATLGQLAGVLAAASGDSPDLASLATTVKEVNAVWVEVKHRNDPPASELRRGLEAIRRVYDLVDQTG